MAKAIALTQTARRTAIDPVEILRAALVLASGLALAFAGPVLPF